MCQLVGAVLLVASMALCFLYGLVSDSTCPVLYTSDSGRHPVTWLLIFSGLLSTAGCVCCLLMPSTTYRERNTKREDEEFGIGLCESLGGAVAGRAGSNQPPRPAGASADNLRHCC